MKQQESALSVNNISKNFATVRAVDDLSFELHYGEIFGLLGPNGAGKTTAIRMVLDIIKPDSGKISILGGPMDEAKKERIGYLPEERGLYDDMKLLDTLVFLGQLKGLTRQKALARAEEYLREMDLWEAHDRKISALSRGMNQKAQFIAASLHDPELIIVDEPFSGLDPVNTRIIKRLIYRMRDRGAAIIMSTHQMNQVEEMCSRILLIDKGRQVLYGDLTKIRQDFAPNAVEVEAVGELSQIPGVERITRQDGRHRLLLQEGVPPDKVLKDLVNLAGISVQHFERVQSSMEEIFVRLVGHEVHEETETE
ncbi:MAG: ATP-binding cassette domain-containing protein [Anaerolineales bacterium]|nr:ATP-binding cassette domain-containing protein [Anaerolineales bacterium]